VRQRRDNEISGHLQTLIDDAEVDELKAPALADYTRKHRIAHAVRSATEKQIARLLKSGAQTPQTLEPLEVVVRELKLDESSYGLDSMSRARAKSIKDAQTIIASLRQKRRQTESELLPDIRTLTKCFHSGGLERNIPKIVRQPTEFLQLLDLAYKTNTNGSTPEHAYEQLQPVANNITGLGPNWVTEILHALDPSIYAVLNKNSVAGMALAGIEFPAKPSKAVISGDVYGEFCRQGATLVKSLGLKNLSELDLVFNYAYWNSEGGDE
jgi:hypothetical protein